MTLAGAWRRTASAAVLLGADGAMRPTIFSEMSALAAETGSINLGQGFPDYDGPPEILEAARAAIAEGVNQYPPGRGTAVLREAISRHRQRFHGLEFDPGTEVLVTAGASEALTATILALTEPGDEVVTLEPFYDLYAGAIGLAGARHVTVPLRAPEFLPDLDDLRGAVNDRTRLIVLNDPHNPTGAMLPRAALELVVELAHRHDALIVTDEVYEHLVFDGRHAPIAALPGARERTVSISSGGKTFSTTGWKIGWLTSTPRLVEAVLAVKQFLTFVNGAPFQPAIAAGLDLPDAYFERLAADLRHKRDVLTSGLTAAGFGVSHPRAGYFVVADAAGLGFDDGADLCRRLPELAGVVAVPITAFVHEEHRAGYRSLVRFAFCKRLDVLERASARLAGLAG